MEDGLTDLTRDSFQCAICLQLMHRPVSLPCGHNFCSICLRDQVRRCPVCRSQLEIKSSSLQVNHLLDVILHSTFEHTEEYKAQAKRKSSVKPIPKGKVGMLLAFLVKLLWRVNSFLPMLFLMGFIARRVLAAQKVQKLMGMVLNNLQVNEEVLTDNFDVILILLAQVAQHVFSILLSVIH